MNFTKSGLTLMQGTN